MKEFEFHNEAHLGDSVFFVHYLRKLCEKYDDVRIQYYIRKKYFGEIQAQINEFSDRIILCPFGEHHKDTLGGWAASKYNGRTIGTAGKAGRINLLNERYDAFFQMVSDHIGLENPIPGKNATLIDNKLILETAHKDLIDFDILLINSRPLSGQYRYKGGDFNTKIEELKERFKIITTDKTIFSDIPCTLDYKLNLLQIGNVSTNVEYIIGIATGPIINCFNIWNIDKIKKWFVLSNRSTYTYNNRIFRKQNILQLKIEELN